MFCYTFDFYDEAIIWFQILATNITFLSLCLAA